MALDHSNKGAYVSYDRKYIPPRGRSEFAEWLQAFEFHRFVTLATNQSADELSTGPTSSNEKMRSLLRKWDARVNRKVAGRNWSSRPEDRMSAHYFLEKPAANPHWHGLIQFTGERDGSKCNKAHIFDCFAEQFWLKLVPSGTVVFKRVTEIEHLVHYVTKEFDRSDFMRNYVTADEFR